MWNKFSKEKFLNRLKSLPWSAILTIALAVFVVYRRAPEVVKNYKLEQQVFPTRKLQTQSGQLIDFPPRDGKPSVALFWATWCGPCKLEMERIQKAINANKLPAQRVFAIHIGGTSEQVRSHMLKYNFTFPALVDADGVLAGTLDVSMTPTLFLVDSNMQITWASSGLGLSDVWRIEQFLK